jgi:FMN phosphatase YigB (HAD superfamily)/DNA-binding XRE family transcriptional regulator
MDEQSLGRVLQAARKSAGMTQQELCQKADISYSTLAKIERGAIKAPSIFTVQRLMEVLGLTFDGMMGNSSPAKGRRGRSKTGVSFIYFDINGCLVRFFNRAFVQLAHDTGAPADAVEGAFWHYNDAICRGEITLEEFNSLLAEQIGVESIDWQAYYMAAVDPITEMHEVVSWAAEHYRIGLLSNIMPGFIKVMIDTGLLPDIKYDAIIDSSVVGVNKPEKQIYEIAMEQAKAPAEEIMLVDDTPGNLVAAEKLGWHVLGFDDYRPAESSEHVRHALELAN